jgi:hypothetical protein
MTDALTVNTGAEGKGSRMRTPKQRAACEPDAMRLCNQYIPDVQRVSACVSAYRRYLRR